ncbi:hypothetical protein O9992_22065 [Vibrio lentus]|nr:hypothetical protein [Vibrio lentus]
MATLRWWKTITLVQLTLCVNTPFDYKRLDLPKTLSSSSAVIGKALWLNQYSAVMRLKSSKAPMTIHSWRYISSTFHRCGTLMISAQVMVSNRAAQAADSAALACAFADAAHLPMMRACKKYYKPAPEGEWLRTRNHRLRMPY